MRADLVVEILLLILLSLIIIINKRENKIYESKILFLENENNRLMKKNRELEGKISAFNILGS